MNALFDHVAIEVKNLDESMETMVNLLGLRALRFGRRYGTGERIVVLGDGTGAKLELIETGRETNTLAHLAFRVTNIDDAHSELVERGLTSASGPHALDAARATTSLLADDSGLKVQLISYMPGSPDMEIWVTAEGNGAY